MARRSGQIPLDDEPMDIDLGDLPSEQEFADAEAATDEVESDAPGIVNMPGRIEQPGALALLQTWVTLVAVLYFVAGWIVGLVFAFQGAAGAGLSALGHPAFYVLVLFWPIAVWQLFWNQI